MLLADQAAALTRETKMQGKAVSTKSRWITAASGIVVMMTLGTIYSWSLFTQPLTAGFGWSNMTTTWTFALAIFSLSLGAMVGGRWQDRVGPRKVAFTGVMLWALGNCLAGLGTAHFGAGWMYLTYGLIGGFGVGMGYVTPVTVITKWFPDKRGLGGGLVVAGFGLGAVVYNLTVQNIPSFAAAAQAAAELATAPETLRLTGAVLAQEHISALMNVFVISGIAFALIGGGCALMLENPPAAYRRNTGTTRRVFNRNRSYTAARILRTPQFYLLWLMLFLNVTAGILVISNAVPIMQELTGLAPAVVAATYAVVALFNALGRFFWGAMSDRIGRNRTFALIFSIQAIAFGMLGGLHDLMAVAIGIAVVLLCFGGGFGTMPSFAADYFGTRRMGANYGMLLSAWGFAGIAGPLFAAYVKDATGSYGGTLIPIALMLVVAMLLPMITRKPALGGSSVMRGTRSYLSSNPALAGASARD